MMQNGIAFAETLTERASSVIIPTLSSQQQDPLVIRNYAGFYCYFQGFLCKPTRAITDNMAAIKDAIPLRVILWAPPRSLSTAFERCIASSADDVRIYHEMFTAAYHLGPERQADIPVPAASQVVSDRKFTYEWVQKELERDHSDGTRVVFCKELGYTMQGHFSSLPSGYRHTFLIRHPAKVFLSMNRLVEKFVTKHVLKLGITDILPQGLVFKELYELFCYITNTLGQNPIIIDADDLIERPEKTLRAYCQAIGIPYSSTMMHWNPLKDETDRWTFSKRLMLINKIIGQYDRAFSTSELEKGAEKPLDLRKVTPEVLHATEASVQYYEKLYMLRLRPEGEDSGPREIIFNDNSDLRESEFLASSTAILDLIEDDVSKGLLEDDVSSGLIEDDVSSGFSSEGEDDVFENNAQGDASPQPMVEINIEIDD